MSGHKHWDEVYATKSPQQLSWFHPRQAQSLSLIEKYGQPGKPVIDIGAGISLLVDQLLARGYTDLTLLDVSARALDITRHRLGDDAASVEFIVADATDWQPAKRYAIWHDRAAFHFLTGSDDRRQYVAALLAGLEVGGHAIFATFAKTGPKRCSSLDVVRYEADSLGEELGGQFNCVEHFGQAHITPWGSAQDFLWAVFQRTG